MQISKTRDMGMQVRLVLFLIVTSNAVLASGFSDKVDLGPFAIGFTINSSIQPIINTSGPVKQNGFDEYYFQLRAGPFRGRAINVTIDDYGNNSTEVSETRLMSLITDAIKSNTYKLDWNKLSIGNMPGIMAQVQDSESFTSYTISAFSPDEKDKKGETIVLIKSSLPGDITDSFLHDLKVVRVSSNNIHS